MACSDWQNNMDNIRPANKNKTQRKNISRPRTYFGIPIRILASALILYVFVSLFQALQHSYYTIRYSVVTVDVNAPSLFLCVRYPVWLAADGDSQKGIISIRLLDSSNRCEFNFAPFPPTQVFLFSSTPIPTYSIASTSMPTNTSIGLDNYSVITQPFISQYTTPISFTIHTSSGLRFVDSQDVTYSPVLGLQVGDEVSVKVEHARIRSSESIGQIAITQISTSKQIYPTSQDVQIKLENTIWESSLRKFIEILLAPATGAIALLATLVLSYLQEDDKKKKDWLDQKQKEIVDLLDKTQNSEVFTILQQWFSEINRLGIDTRDISFSTSNRIADRLIAYAKDYNSNNFLEQSSGGLDVVERIQKLAISDTRSDSLYDLQLILTDDIPDNPNHVFVDPFFLGFYANKFWKHTQQRSYIEAQFEKLFMNSNSDDDKNLLYGIFRCYEQQSLSEQSLSLISDLSDYYINDQKTDSPKSWLRLTELFDEIHNYIKLEQWLAGVKKIRDEGKKAKAAFSKPKHPPEYLQERITSDFRTARNLWPLENISYTFSHGYNANYDFPHDISEIDEIAFRSIYELVNATLKNEPNKKVSAIDICEDHLSKPFHNLITSTTGCGKTWLRIYLEYYLLASGEKSLPVFYFPPVTLAYQFDELMLVRSLAISVANHLFADLIVRSSVSISDKDLRVSRAAIIPFLKFFGYDVFNGSDCLAQPIPTQQELSIDAEYGQSYHRAAYLAMKGMMEQPINLPYSLLATNNEEILDLIQHAMEIADYRSLFIFIDNWEHVPDIPRNRLLHKMLQPNFLQQLQKRQLFLKLFMPSTDELPLTHFQKTCDIVRFESKGTSNEEIPPHLLVDVEETTRFTLQLYTYHESIVQPDVVQPTTS